MNNILSSILFKVIRIEHIIYCATNCKIELLLHKHYYNYSRVKYEEYVNKVLTPKFDW